MKKASDGAPFLHLSFVHASWPITLPDTPQHTHLAELSQVQAKTSHPSILNYLKICSVSV
jgi:hypothetical protein